ncbi:MAG TPA: cbb3-type cytochrome c oxidase subunit II [Candidatus Didemnitutus sp.]|nr:cbb3-type cytochrome c oxidase subunit II [Candidatus Didemnitutus sp.]
MLRRLGQILFVSLATLALGDAVDDATVAMGRKVYLAEGCINCHSQYVRPETADAQRWGPTQPLGDTLAQTPPLFGNRRQGPDLQNVGNRRSREWQRLHLIAPRRVTPGSRMPSYAHLFADDDQRGDDLLDYLESLGRGSILARSEWTPPAGETRADSAAQQRLFVQWCASCHGESGHGDGPAAAQLSIRPRSLATDPWRYQPTETDAGAERQALARTIKFGVPGTAMAGREYLSDADVLALATYVQSMHEPHAAPKEQP